MTYYYSPHTGEHIVTNDPADWMDRTEIAPPAHDANESAVFLDGAWTIVSPQPQPTPVPSILTMRQARLALLRAGLLSGVDAVINGLSEPDRSAAKIEWEYGGVVDRFSGLVPVIGVALGMTESQIDDLFVEGAKL